jgi:hypothetical protein
MGVVRVVPVVSHDENVPGRHHKLWQGVGRRFVDERLDSCIAIHKELAIVYLRRVERERERESGWSVSIEE